MRTTLALNGLKSKISELSCLKKEQTKKNNNYIFWNIFLFQRQPRGLLTLFDLGYTKPLPKRSKKGKQGKYITAAPTSTSRLPKTVKTTSEDPIEDKTNKQIEGQQDKQNEDEQNDRDKLDLHDIAKAIYGGRNLSELYGLDDATLEAEFC